MTVYELTQGDAPLLVSLPHDGVALPPDIAEQMTDVGRASLDTDWHVGKLYAFAQDLGATILRAKYSRYVIDLNRPFDGKPLYHGQDETGLAPVTSFAGQPLYKAAEGLRPAAITERVNRYWKPYHQALAEELERLQQAHGNVVLWEGHSIRSRVPRFFSGTLPDLNVGTNDGASCSARLLRSIETVLADQSRFSWVINGRFKGGFITRNYGQPARGIHAIQLEMAQTAYMLEDDANAWDAQRAAPAQSILRNLLTATLEEVGQ